MVRTWLMDVMIISICFVFSKLFYCFVITTAVGGANVQHHRYTYCAAGIKSVSPPNRLVTRHRLNDQGDGDHDLCTNGSYAEATVMFTSTNISAVEVTANVHGRQSGEVQGDSVVTLHRWLMCPHDGDDSLHTCRSFSNAAVLVHTHTGGSCSNAMEVRTLARTDHKPMRRC
jgi:hypothetical protein